MRLLRISFTRNSSVFLSILIKIFFNYTCFISGKCTLYNNSFCVCLHTCLLLSVTKYLLLLVLLSWFWFWFSLRRCVLEPSVGSAWRYISLYTKLLSFFLPQLSLRVIFVIFLVYFCFLFHLVCLNDCVLHILLTSSSCVCGCVLFSEKKRKEKKREEKKKLLCTEG